MEGDVISSDSMNPHWYVFKEDSRWLPVIPGAPLKCILRFSQSGRF
jgi:hypothetical protein